MYIKMTDTICQRLWVIYRFCRG